MLIIALAILIALACVNLFMTKRGLHPSVVYAAIWAIQLAGLVIFSDRFIKPSAEVLLIVVLGAIFFSIGSHLSSVAVFFEGHIIHPRKVRRDTTLFLIFAIVVAICLYGQYRIFSELVHKGNFAESLVYARTLMSIENEDIYGLYKYGSPIALGVMLALQILIIRNEANLLHKILFGYFLVAALFMAVISTGRGPIAFIFLLLGLVYIFSSDRKIITRRVGIISVAFSAFTFVVFWIMGSAMGKADEAALGAMSDLIDYLFSSIPALSVYLDQNQIHIIGGDWGSNTLRFFFSLAAAAGLAEKPVSLVQEFVPVPHLTNLYTTYLQYVQDFGWSGIVVVPLFIGYLYGYLFRWSMNNKKDEFALYMLCISYLPLLQSVFQETLFVSLSSWIQFALIGFVISKIYKIRL